MGFFSDDDDQPSQSPGDAAVQQQIAMTEKELEQKRQSLYSQRLDIIKSQGGTNWNPTPKTPNKGTQPQYGKPADVFGVFGDRFLTAAITGQARNGIAGKQPTLS